MERIDESPLTAEEKANLDLLEITDGILTGVIDEEKLVGSLVTEINFCRGRLINRTGS